MKLKFWRIIAITSTACLLFFTILVAYRLFYPRRYTYSLGDSILHICVGEKSYIENTKTGKILLDSIEVCYPSKDGNAIVIYVKDGTNKRGLLNVNSGKVVSEPIYDAAWIFTDSVGAVCLSDSVFFVDMQGNRINRFKYRREPYFDYQYHDGFCVIKIADKYGLIDKSGEWVFSPTFDLVEYIGSGAWRLRIKDIYQYFFKDNPDAKLPTLISIKGDTIFAKSDSVRLYVRQRDLGTIHSK